MGKPKSDPVVGFVKVVYGKRVGDKRIRREGEKALARQGMRLVFEDEKGAAQ